MNILFYGNCQTWAVKETLKLPNSTVISCWDTTLTKEEFVSILGKSDVIITQPISDDYRNKDYLSTSFILKHTKAKIILFDSCYFEFYYFDLTYHEINSVLLREPSDYHYKTILEKKMDSIDIILDPTLKTKEELELLAENSLQEMNRRYIENQKYNVHVISIHDFVKQNYKDKLLFYSMNHPSKYVIQYICEEIIKHLQWKNTINYEIDILNNPKCILYSCIQSAVHFDISKHQPLTSEKTTVPDIVSLYCETYKRVGI
jgi:hypothetical protein